MSASKDSTQDTMAHIAKVRNYLYQTSDNLVDRGQVHDQSKLESVEKPGFDRVVGALEGLSYPSDEYRAALKLVDLKPTLEHHYANNRHHPEHYPNGINGMSWPDIEEMLDDWKSASERMSNASDFGASLVHNRKRFEISNQLFEIMVNTCKERGWVSADWVIPSSWEEGLDVLAAVYTERARLIALAAACFPSWHDEDPDAEDGYKHLVYIELPTGQCSWHIADTDWHFFEGTRWTMAMGSGPLIWDGHSTDQKHERIETATLGLNRMEYGIAAPIIVTPDTDRTQLIHTRGWRPVQPGSHDDAVPEQVGDEGQPGESAGSAEPETTPSS